MSNASTRPPGYGGFHLATCASNRFDSPASDEWCVRECPRRLLAEVGRLQADNDRLRAAILRHRALVRNGSAWTAFNNVLWAALEDEDA
jgi:hypothetical protein